jgi:hypothetical protein
MFQLKLTMKIEGRAKLNCGRHPLCNPQTQGRGAIIGGCSECLQVHEAYVQISVARAHLENAIRHFTKIIAPREAPSPGRYDTSPHASQA